MHDYTINERGDVRMKEAAVPVMKTFEEPRTAQTAGGLLAGNALWLV